MNCDIRTASTKVVTVENCANGGIEGTIMNLSPEFPIPKDQLHQDFIFPWMQHADRIREAQAGFNIPDLSFSSLDEAVKFSERNPVLSVLWATVKSGWSLTHSGRYKIAESKLQSYKPTGYAGPPIWNYVLFDFCYRLLNPGCKQLFEVAATLILEVKNTNPSEYERFISYYKAELYEENVERYFDIFKEYFKGYSDYSQTLFFIQHNITFDSNYCVTSRSFSSTKLFYGNAFEGLTSNLVVLACLNNIYCGRRYDQFQSMDLRKYLTINKANRASPFSDTPAFSALSDCLDSTLRNASHHGAIKTAHNHSVVTYRSGGNGAIRRMSYQEYLNKCNNIMISCTAVLMLELVLGFESHQNFLAIPGSTDRSIL